jgi:hypothetical protein
LTQTTTIGAIARIGIVWLATMEQARMGEDDADREADDRADGETDERLLPGEERLVEEDGDERRLVDLRRLAERLEDRPHMRHRRVVDDERPRPTGRRPDPAVQLPEADEREHGRGDGGDATKHRLFLSRFRIAECRSNQPAPSPS